MRDDLDEVMARLAASRAERSLDGFEETVLRGVAHQRQDMRTAKALAPYRIATVGMALAVGVTSGGMAAMTVGQPRQVSPFSTATHLAPSTLLGGDR